MASDLTSEAAGGNLLMELQEAWERFDGIGELNIYASPTRLKPSQTTITIIRSPKH